MNLCRARAQSPRNRLRRSVKLARNFPALLPRISLPPAQHSRRFLRLPVMRLAREAEVVHHLLQLCSKSW